MIEVKEKIVKAEGSISCILEEFTLLVNSLYSAGFPKELLNATFECGFMGLEHREIFKKGDFDKWNS